MSTEVTVGNAADAPWQAIDFGTMYAEEKKRILQSKRKFSGIASLAEAAASDAGKGSEGEKEQHNPTSSTTTTTDDVGGEDHTPRNHGQFANDLAVT